jgi:hypothetical protein
VKYPKYRRQKYCDSERDRGRLAVNDPAAARSTICHRQAGAASFRPASRSICGQSFFLKHSGSDELFKVGAVAEVWGAVLSGDQPVSAPGSDLCHTESTISVRRSAGPVSARCAISAIDQHGRTDTDILFQGEINVAGKAPVHEFTARDREPDEPRQFMPGCSIGIACNLCLR